MCVFTLFIVGFLTALHNLFWYFSPDVIRASQIPTPGEFDAALNSPAVQNFGR